MKLYEINSEIEKIVANATDPETGEFLETGLEALNALQYEKSSKVLDIACLIRGLEAEAQAHAEEVKKQQARKQTLERKADWLRDYLKQNCEGEQFSDVRIGVTWRRSEAVEVTNLETIPETYIRTKREADKVAITKALKAGEQIAGARLETRLGLMIK